MKKENKNGFNSSMLMSFKNAFTGIALLIRSERNARVHLIALILVIFAGLIFKISIAEWLAIAFASGLVFICESFNTSIEYLSDEVSPGFSEKIRKAKDVASAGVLISAFLSVAVGVLIFIPRIAELFRN